MSFPERPVLQHRWQVVPANQGFELVYFGLRNPPGHLRSVIGLEADLARELKSLDGSGPASAMLAQTPLFADLVRESIMVDISRKREPATPEHNLQCVRCVTNDWLIPGLEFDERGVCALCQCYERAEKTGRSAGPREGITDEELQAVAAANTGSRFDVMVLCTGGKDSTFLLWYLAKKLGLRVLAASWNMPYTNDTCRENFRRSMTLLPDVEFVERTLPWNLIRQAMHDQLQGVGLPCLCPMTAHALFYPLAFQEKIPLIMHGVEEVQLAVMSYVMSELKQGAEAGPEPIPDYRDNTLGFLRAIARGRAPQHPWAMNAEMARYMASIRRVLAPVFGPLEDFLDRAEADPELAIPHLRRLRTNTSYGSWADVAELIKREMGWRMPPGRKGLLHTSCRIETVKDHFQFKRFTAMETTMLPQSVVELGAGVYFGLISREDALAELEELGYQREPEALAPLLSDLNIKNGHAPLLSPRG
jgi:hypothetical protein